VVARPASADKKPFGEGILVFRNTLFHRFFVFAKGLVVPMRENASQRNNGGALAPTPRRRDCAAVRRLSGGR